MTFLETKEIKMTYHVPHLINGQLIKTSGRKLNIYSPAKGTVIGEINVADKETVDVLFQSRAKHSQRG